MLKKAAFISSAALIFILSGCAGKGTPAACVPGKPYAAPRPAASSQTEPSSSGTSECPGIQNNSEIQSAGASSLIAEKTAVVKSESYTKKNTQPVSREQAASRKTTKSGITEHKQKTVPAKNPNHKKQPDHKSNPGKQSGYRLTKLFSIPADGNMQGLAFADGNYFIGFDAGNGMGKIDEFSSGGRFLRTSGLLPIEHAAELAFRKADACLYVSNGQPDAPVHIYAVNMNGEKPDITNRITPDTPGYGGLVAVDNDRDVMIISTNSIKIGIGGRFSNSGSTVTFYTCDFAGKVKSRFTLPYMGVPQGIEALGGSIYFYTNNRITVIREDGKIIRKIDLNESGESEGMTSAVQDGRTVLTVGYSYPGRIFMLNP